MKWISRYSPIYIWENDEWLRESDGKVFKASFELSHWISQDGEKVQFSPKSRILYEMDIC